MPWSLDFLLGGESRKPCVFSRLSLVNRVPCIYASEGRKAEDPFRGLRAGPASFPRPLPSNSYISYRPNTAGSLHSSRSAHLQSFRLTAKFNPFKNAWERKFHSRLQSSHGWGVVQLVGHLTVNEDGVGSSPTAPAKSHLVGHAK